MPRLPTPRNTLRHILTPKPQQHCRALTLPPRTPVIETCPAPDPGCACAPMPPGLEIDHDAALDGTMAAYDVHASMQTARLDWASRIEAGDGLAARVKRLLGRRGALFNPTSTTLVTAEYTADLSPSAPLTLSIFPSCTAYTLHPTIDEPQLTALLRHILPNSPSSSSSTTTTSFHTPPPEPQPSSMQQPIIQICSHMSRDERCGILGPLLRTAFQHALSSSSPSSSASVSARTALVSHIGGHRFAGNVIIYFPPRYYDSPLAGMGVWYGRVEPRHVPGIVSETVVRGRVVSELCRGVIGPFQPSSL